MRGALVVGSTALVACLSKPSQHGPGSGVDSGSGSAFSPLHYEQAFAHEQGSPTFPGHAVNVGDAVVFHVSCVQAGFAATAISLGAPNWQVDLFGPISQVAGCCATQAFAAIAPDVGIAQFTVTTTPSCPSGKVVVLADEFSGNDRAGGTTTFAGESAAGDVQSVSIAVRHPGEVVWAAVTSAGAALVVSPYQPGAGSNGNVAEYVYPAGEVGSLVPMSFDAQSGPNEITVVSIKPQ